MIWPANKSKQESNESIRGIPPTVGFTQQNDSALTLKSKPARLLIIKIAEKYCSQEFLVQTDGDDPACYRNHDNQTVQRGGLSTLVIIEERALIGIVDHILDK